MSAHTPAPTRPGSLAWAELRQHPSRMAAVILAVGLSVAFVSASLVFIQTETRAAGRAASAPIANADAVVRPPQAEPGRTAALWHRLSSTPGAAVVEPTWQTYVTAHTPAGSALLRLHTVARTPELRWGTLEQGTWPSQAGEAVVSAATARRQQLTLGDRIRFDGEEPLTVRVVGITADTDSLLTGGTDSAGLTVDDLLAHPHLAGQATFIALGSAGVTPDMLVDRLTKQLVGTPYAHAAVVTAEQAVHHRLLQIANGFNIYRNLLLAFGAIALLVGMIIIANTFTILIAQRRRWIGLLRAVGAGTSQVRRTLLAEALGVGIVGSLAGVAVGVGVATAAAAWSGSLRWGLDVRWSQLALTVAAGVLLTVIAALAPAARATRIRPLEALRPATATVARRGTVARAVAAVVLVGSGGGLVALALAGPLPHEALLLAIAGAFLLAVGVLLGGRFYVPALLRLIGVGIARCGATARLAVRNGVRNPGRAAATCTALMLATGLIVTLQVGAASVTATLDRGLDDTYPVDLIVQNVQGHRVSGDVVDRVDGVDGVAAGQLVEQTGVQVGSHGLTVAGISKNTEVIAAGLDALDDRHVLVHPVTALNLGLEAGQQLRLTSHDSAASLTVALSKAAGTDTMLVTPAILHRLDPKAVASSLWISVPDRSKAGDALADVQQIIGNHTDLRLSGSLPQSAQIEHVLNVLLGIATGLLAVAVVIALIGVGNTLGLSVLERTRESALMRALGLQRSQLRGMLAIEAVSLAVVGAAVGIVAGIGFGWLGTAAVVRQMDLRTTELRVSAPQTLAVVVVAVCAGLIASVLPARRAVRTPPTQALADVD